MEKNKKNNNLFFYLILFFFLFQFNNSYIVLPFKISEPPKTNNISEIIDNLVDNKLIITLPIGTPEKKIELYATMNHYLYYLEEGSCLKNTSSSYNNKDSESFFHYTKLTSCSVKLDSCSFAKEKLYLYQDINLKKKYDFSKFEFFIGNRKANSNINNNTEKTKICGILGFQMENLPYHYYEYDNFITSLKKSSIINSYSWYIHYYEKPYKINENEFYDGAIVLDVFNQDFFDDFTYLKKDNVYNIVNAKDLEAILAWTFSFEKIYYAINDTRIFINNLIGGLAFETDLVQCPWGYFDSIKNKFFDYYFKNNICFLAKGSYNYIYCDKKQFEKDVKNFPTLYFRSNGLDKIFSLTGEDLFRKFDDYLLFMIVYKEFSYKYWTLGKIFLKKYNFYFDNDKKIIGCFDVVEPKKEEDTNFFIKAFNTIKWYLLIILGIIIGFLIGKKIREKARKIRANELEDNYEYLSNKANSTDNTNNNNNNTITNYKEIKSQSQLFDLS